MKRSMRLQASFSVEASYVFWIVLFAIVFFIRVAFKERDKALAGYVAGEANEAASHIEETYDPDGQNSEKIGKYIRERLADIPGLSSADAGTERNSRTCESYIRQEQTDRNIRQKINNPESWMRNTTAVEDIIERIRKNDNTKSE